MMWRLIDPQHPMYDKALAARFGDSIERVYRRCDEFVGEVMSRVDPSTPIIIVSDHGFHSFRQSVNLNTWLVQEGFMAIQGQQPGEKKLEDLFGGGTFWENVDWSHTRAYAMGLGQIYLNRRGREGHGIVTDAEAKQVENDLADRLLTMTDPKTHQRIVDAVYKREDIYSGPFFDNAAEIQVGLADGYRVSWQSTLGGSPPGIVYPNMKKWSGDHGSFDYKQTSGVLISSRKVDAASPSIMDIAPTVLKYFGVPIPSDIDGKPLF
jgi:predicted AlkP superfamily phosphohydrolase/phosphomutase